MPSDDANANPWSLAMVRAQGVMFLALAAGAFALLAYWYTEPVLWALFGPVALASLNLGLHLWRPSAATRRAVLYWMIAVIWLLLLIVLSFENVTIVAGLFTAATAGGIAWVVHVSVQSAIARDE